jgi:hypothetical protein
LREKCRGLGAFEPAFLFGIVSVSWGSTRR